MRPLRKIKRNAAGNLLIVYIALQRAIKLFQAIPVKTQSLRTGS